MDKQVRSDSGALMATQSKKNDKSPDYWGEIAINIKDLTNVEMVDGLAVFRLSGWKKRSKSGNTFLSIAVNRMAPKQAVVQHDEEEPF